MKIIAALIVMLSMPLALAESVQQVDMSRVLAGSEHGRGEDVIALPGRPGAWLVAGAIKGLSLVDDNGRWHTLHPGYVESLDARGNVAVAGAEGTLISAIDQDSGEVMLALLVADALRELARFASDQALPETQCLYRDPDLGHVSLFTVDARGMVHQRIVVDADRQAVVDIPVREFIGVPEAEACVVDDRHRALYVAEETLGVWRYDASAESDPARQPVALVAPHGALPGEVADLAVADAGELWVLSAQPAVAQRYGRQGLQASLALPAIAAAKAFALARDGDSLMLAVYDEDRDSVRLAGIGHQPDAAPEAGEVAIAAVKPVVETDPVNRFGDAADDPVIWIDPRDPARSLVIGTDKKEGLRIYGLDGALRQSLDTGRLNNVDLIAATRVNGKSRPLIAASNRSTNGIALFTVDGRRQVRAIGEVATDLEDVYGLCMYQSGTGDYVFVNDSDGGYRQYRVDASGKVAVAELVRRFSLPSQPEGCVADTVTQQLFMGEERAGIWRTGAEPGDSPVEMIIPVDDRLVADVEGMDIYYGGERNYLVVSSQGNDSYLVYGLQAGYPRLAHFRITANLDRGIDGASETDGLAVTANALPGYPQGLLVVQDGRNRMPEQPQNFKLVEWRQVQAVIDGSYPE